MKILIEVGRKYFCKSSPDRTPPKIIFQKKKRKKSITIAPLLATLLRNERL